MGLSARWPDRMDGLLGLLNLTSLGDRGLVCDALRAKAALRFSVCSVEELLNAALSYVQQKESANSDRPWFDRYSPRKLMTQCGLECLLAASNVIAVGANEDGRPEDVIVQFESRRAVFERVVVEGGTGKVEFLRRQLWGIYGQPARDGGYHWCTHEDFGELTHILDIAFAIVGTSPQGLPCAMSQCMSVLPGSTSDSPSKRANTCPVYCVCILSSAIGALL